MWEVVSVFARHTIYMDMSFSFSAYCTFIIALVGSVKLYSSMLKSLRHLSSISSIVTADSSSLLAVLVICLNLLFLLVHFSFVLLFEVDLASLFLPCFLFESC